MTTIERLKKIAELAIPEKIGCEACIEKIENRRRYKVVCLQRELEGLTGEEQEAKIKEWEG